MGKKYEKKQENTTKSMTFYPLCRSNAFYFIFFLCLGSCCRYHCVSFVCEPSHLDHFSMSYSVPDQKQIFLFLFNVFTGVCIVSWWTLWSPPPPKFLCSWLGLQFLTILASIIVLWHSYFKLAFNCVAWTIELLWIYHRGFLGTCHLRSMSASLNLFPPTCSIFAANIHHLNSLPQLKMWSFCCIP